MEISYKDYRIVPCENAPGRFDLNEIVVRNKKDGGSYESFNNHGYGMSFEKCLSDIVSIELRRKQGVVSIGEYIKEFKEVSGIIISEIQNQTKIEKNA